MLFTNEAYMKGTYVNATEAWEALYFGLNRFGDESSPRGLKVRETLDCDIKITQPNDNIILSPIRNLSARYLAAEWLWYLSGDTSLESISKYSKFWTHIANEDGTVNSNYGAYMFINGEWNKIKENIKKDLDTRQAVLQIPITKNVGSKDTPCTSSIQFIVRNGRLNMTVYMRSNDIWKGFAFDVHCFTMMQLKMLRELNEELNSDNKLKLGWYRHVVGSLHVYEPEFAESIIGEDYEFPGYSASFKDCYLKEDKSSDQYLEDLKHTANKEYDLVKNTELRDLIALNRRNH